jgi:hypothetical protein
MNALPSPNLQDTIPSRSDRPEPWGEFERQRHLTPAAATNASESVSNDKAEARLPATSCDTPDAAVESLRPRLAAEFWRRRADR